ncbi:MAG: class I SAM-dependent methyltransferase [Candidatus Methylacidiphilales bacterium]
MSSVDPEAATLEVLYGKRFSDTCAYRKKVWRILIPHFFQRYIQKDARVLDLGCGYGEFINQVDAIEKFGLDLNPESGAHLDPAVKWLQCRSTDDWGIPADSLDVVFTSNFFEHLRNKEDLELTIDRVIKHLKPGGRLIAMGPNINRVHGAYWDFWDHHLPLTELSLAEVLEMKCLIVENKVKSFLPYTMVGKRPVPLVFVKAYLKLPMLWKWFGKQFLVVASKPNA